MVSKVFVTQENFRLDYSPAEQYGVIYFLTGLETTHIKGSDRNDRVMEEISFNLRNFNNEKDYLLLSGDPIIIAMATAIAYKDGNPLNFLKWNNQTREYNPITID